MTRYTIHPDPDRPGFHVLLQWLSETCAKRIGSYSSLALCYLAMPDNVRLARDAERRDWEAVEEWVEECLVSVK